MPAILALDLGTNCGFAIRRHDGRVESGTERFNVRNGETSGDRFNRFRRFLLEVKEKNPELVRVAYEDVVFMGPNGARTAQFFGGLVAIVQMFAAHHILELDTYGVATVKKQFTGSGRAQKHDVIAQCKTLGFNPGTDNEADAIAVLHVATGTCPLLTMSGASSKKRAPKSRPELQPGEVPF